MSKTAYIRARIEPELKIEAEAIFNEFGVTATQVITMLYKQVSRKHEIPLDLSMPNKETIKAIEEARKGKGLTAYKSIDDMFDKLDL